MISPAIANVAPPAPATSSTPATDASSSAHRFDAALDAANKQSKGKDSNDSSSNTQTSTSPAASTPSKAAGTKSQGADESKASDKKDDQTDTTDTSAVAAVLALIGVPPKVATVAGKALGAATDALAGKGDPAITATGQAGDAAAAALAQQAQAQVAAAAAAVAAATPAGLPSVAADKAGLLTAIGATAPKEDTAAPDATTSLALPAMHLHAATQDPQNVQLQSTQPATSPQFAQELGEQIAWMGNSNINQARIRLHPEELGSMDVKVSVEHGKVNVAFATEHPAAVIAVQQTLSQLDTMLAHHGLSLGNTEVSQQNAGQGDGSSARSSGAASGDAGSDEATVVSTTRVSRGLVDEVA
ncbi:flagellar hook-length control protein FliK [Luteibacter rhizovicinus]|uniref:Flagellar hook-length control protein FliK n=1 Tax=Luteibacter rhizovicinus TaxID=242606 RepID=A0A4R3YNE1_9GAMM|nr:flagellar hook-length control protein FliK [Luteibacter rhizovicinus]TCV94157.1 flagellar hook-length control protein FliK [Luteibacter rhizovicinus]